MSGMSASRCTRRRAVLLATVAAVVVAALSSGPADGVDSAAGGLPDGVVVSQNPVDWTPHVLDGRVYAITQVGDRMVVGGQFSRVRQAGTQEVLTRRNLFAFDAATGVIDRSFTPDPDGMVAALVAAPGGGAVFAGGRFRHIAGQAATAVAKLDVPSGRPAAGFQVALSWRVDDLAVHGSRLYLAGGITKVNGADRSGLAAVDVDTGALDPGVNVAFTDPRNGLLFVNRIAVRRDGSRMVALGSFLKADGQERPQIAVLDLAGGPARLADWHTGDYAARCQPQFDTYMRGVDISADGSYFVVVTTGGDPRPLCDAVARFELDRNGHNLQATWVDWSGGDSFTSVAVTDAAVYVGGHQRWLNNPYNNGASFDATPGIGSVPRPGIAALDPANGLPLSWNPGREPRGLGVLALLETPEGLWIGSDTDNVGGEYHPRLALLPTAGGQLLRKPVPSRLPGVLHTVAADRPELTAQAFDGTVVAPARTLGGGVDWTQARAAFFADGRVYTAWADGRMDVRSLDANGAFGPPHNLDLGGLGTFPPAMFPVAQLTGMAFDAQRGLLYHTIEGHRRLYYRYFTPESGIVGGLPLEASGEGDGVDWGQVRGFTIASGHLYYADTAGRLNRIGFQDGRPVPGTATPVDTSRNWASRGMFIAPGG